MLGHLHPYCCMSLTLLQKEQLRHVARPIATARPIAAARYSAGISDHCCCHLRSQATAQLQKYFDGNSSPVTVTGPPGWYRWCQDEVHRAALTQPALSWLASQLGRLTSTLI
jgi:hypothetical protein